MKTVIQFIHELGDGGGSAIVKDYALSMKKDGYRVVVLVVFPELTSVNYQILTQNGIEIRSVFKNKNFIHRLENKICATYFVTREVKRILKDLNPIALHCHLEVLKYVWPCSKDLQDVKVVYTCHSLPQRYFKSSTHSEYKAAKKLLKNNNLQMIALHQEMATALNNMFGINNTKIVGNGIVLDRFISCKKDKYEMRRELGIPENAFLIGHIGRFNKVKNHSFLIKVFKEVADANKNAFLLLIGTGELQGQIEKQIDEQKLNNKVLILTHRTDIPELLRSMDVFVFPSFCEGLSVALIEAQAVHCRCVVSNTITKESIVSNYVTSLSLSDSIETWKKSILNKKDGEFKGNFSSYDIDKIVKQVEVLYE